MKPNVDPSHIMQVGMGFWASKTLLSAVELELFTVLGDRTMTAAQVGDRVGLHPRALFDFLDALVALELLDREGSGEHGGYRNTPASAAFLDKNSPQYLGGMLEMANARLYRFWGNLTEALKTGEPQNELKEGSGAPFELLYSNEERLEQFLRAMQGVQMGNFHTLMEKVDLGKYRSFCDVGGANGTLAAIVANRYPEMSCTTFDLPQVAPVARRHLCAMDADRVEIVAGDFFRDELPRADVITMGNILHDWNETQKRTLIGKAYTAVNDGGMFIAIENIIDNDRRRNAFGLLMSLNMLIELPGGFDYTGRQFDAWAREAGFQSTEIVPLAGPASAAIAFKR